MSDNPKTSTERVRLWRANNTKKQQAWREKNKDKGNTACRKYYEKNRGAQIARASAWAKANPDKTQKIRIKRRNLQVERTPDWVSKSEIKNIYLNCPGGLHVDHIIPFLGKTADGYEIHGLHVPWNLRYLTPIENIQKSNKMRWQDHHAIDVTDNRYKKILRKLRRNQFVSHETFGRKCT